MGRRRHRASRAKRRVKGTGKAAEEEVQRDVAPEIADGSEEIPDDQTLAGE